MPEIISGQNEWMEVGSAMLLRDFVSGSILYS